MQLAYLIDHPEEMNKETLYELRSLLALYPYYQSARLLLLKNLYLLHDPTFDEELRRAAIYIGDRNKLFELVEAAHYRLKKEQPTPAKQAEKVTETTDASVEESRTVALIDDFLEQIPEEDKADDKNGKRKPTPADATIDYVAYLLETEATSDLAREPMKGQNLIDTFLHEEGGKIELKEETEYEPEIPDEDNDTQNSVEEEYFTETLARIYIKQGRYLKALEIIQRLNLIYPKKNSYFADQIRFLEKIIRNDAHS